MTKDAETRWMGHHPALSPSEVIVDSTLEAALDQKLQAMRDQAKHEC